MPCYLALETSSAQTDLCLACDGGKLYEKQITKTDSHSESLAVGVQELISGAGISACDISAIIVAAGPGSFTGLRIGFSFAKGFALSLKCPLYTISSLAAAAAEFSSRFKLVCSLRDARREEVFWEAFLKQGQEELVSVGGPGIMAAKDVPGTLAALAQRLSVAESEIGVVSAEDLSPYKLATDKPRHAARHLLDLWKCAPKSRNSGFNLSELIELQPYYMRAVAAKTIAERAILPG